MTSCTFAYATAVVAPGMYTNSAGPTVEARMGRLPLYMATKPVASPTMMTIEEPSRKYRVRWVINLGL